MEKLNVDEKLSKLGEDIFNQIKEKRNPCVEIPIRTLLNVYFDENTGLLNLGESRSKRSLLNVAHIKKFMQMLMVSAKCKELIKENKHASLRELYYQLKYSVGESKENTVEDEKESNACVVDLENIMGVFREELNLNAKKNGSLYGDVILSQDEDVFNCSKLGRGGWAVPSNMGDLKIESLNVDYCLVIETDAMYERLIEEKFSKRENCLLMSTEGQAPRGVRRLINRLFYEFNLPIIIFTDGDPSGYYIYSVIKHGSMSLAHLSKHLGTPKAKYVGMTMEDVYEYDLQNVTEKLKEYDIKRAKELMNYPWFKDEKWQKQFKLMLKKNIRLEQQALANKGLEFVAKKYLPEKIAAENFLP